jgi:hypothetical protein
MPKFAEEFMLLALSDPKGGFVREPPERFENALAGAILMDLALLNRIDTDLEHLILIDAKPIGDPLLDEVMALIQKFPDSKSTAYWIEEIRYHIGDSGSHHQQADRQRHVEAIGEETSGIIPQKLIRPSL